ncbi:MAG: TonB-dependent receptor, partial [Bacteroidales bacterium]|nr:TonB-dependent receptor [Bacteroidales bacterium]
MKNTLYKTATAMLSIILATCIAFSSYGKDNITHAIKGKVIDYDTRLGVDYANVVIKGTNLWALTDEQGNFSIENVSAGIYNLECSKMGYQKMVTPDYIVSTKDIYITIEIRQDASLLDELVVYSPISSLGKDNLIGTRDISLQEIEISPGGNRDISKIVQQKPGVSFSPVGYRNDLIVRGGSPIENKFYIDGIEIPNINHFSTQGATGGPVGILNADLIRSAQLHTGSFPIFSSNALSSVMNIQLQNGNLEKTSLKASFGGSEFALTGSGHIKKK